MHISSFGIGWQKGGVMIGEKTDWRLENREIWDRGREVRRRRYIQAQYSLCIYVHSFKFFWCTFHLIWFISVLSLMPKGEIVGIMIYLSLVTTLIQLWMVTEQYSVYRAFSGYRAVHRAFSGYRAVQCILSIQRLPSSTVYTEHSAVTEQFSAYRAIGQISSVYRANVQISSVYRRIEQISSVYRVIKVNKGNNVYRVNKVNEEFRVLPSHQAKLYQAS